MDKTGTDQAVKASSMAMVGAPMEGPLSKWTNVVKGWQYRWFVLDETAGILSYYTSKDKMMRGSRRGCLRLKNAVIGIDDEDDSTFTINSDQKIFHFQARDEDERERWIRALEETITNHSQPRKKFSKAWLTKSGRPFSEALDVKLAEADAYYVLLTSQITTLEDKINSCTDDGEVDNLLALKASAHGMLEAIKRALDMLHTAKNSYKNCENIAMDLPQDDEQPSPKTLKPYDEVVYPFNTASPNQTSQHDDTVKDNHKSDTLQSTVKDSTAVKSDQPLPDDLIQLDLDQPKELSDESTALTSEHVTTTSSHSEPVQQTTLAHQGGFTNDMIAPPVDTNTETSMPANGEVEPISLPADQLRMRLDVPAISYSSSEDEDSFYDADNYDSDENVGSLNDHHLRSADSESVNATPELLQKSADGGSTSVVADEQATQPQDTNAMSNTENLSLDQSHQERTTQEVSNHEIQPEDEITMENCVEDPDDDPASITDAGSDGNQSVITHVLSQLKLGMDLTKVTLPTFILESKSLLEMYADFFTHADIFVSIADMQSPRERMERAVMWYLSAFHAGRKSTVAKKPYNPILGETFRCYFDLDTKNVREITKDGPLPWVSKDSLAFVAEQVSHHPPVSAFYSEHYNKRISFCGHIWTKSKFLGLSIGVHNIGQGCISLPEYDEEYIVTFPNGYARSILSVPWVELGGKTSIVCAKTGYTANIEFHTKPFYGGKKNRITAEIIPPSEKKPWLSISGEWNGSMTAKDSSGVAREYLNTKAMQMMKKIVPPMVLMDVYESRRLWNEVTINLKSGNIDDASAAKRFLEDRQRAEARQRKEAGESWDTKLFHLDGDNWVYDNLLQKRI
ncbi:Oxysterol-binding protein-related protein 9 [Trichoplax sp. H2]|nr:Oxysterol-binding protein-related protein 9 [Trichoplax sp. H2]|eukprot:RDD40206.1 Oxysterol-binding protein-related protein 9 [Trichoplax sp. H2]